jgi:hypothetical protein
MTGDTGSRPGSHGDDRDGAERPAGESRQAADMSMGIGLGIALGAGIGVAFGNIGIGIAVGLALGAAIGAARSRDWA